MKSLVSDNAAETGSGAFVARAACQQGQKVC
jgi:hypothetical protein